MGKRIQRIGSLRKECWCLIGDFNDLLLHNGEKTRRPCRDDFFFVGFTNMIKGCEMKELASSGNAFTWRGRRYRLWIQCQLNRCFGNKKWHKKFPASNQAFLEKRGSDHRPALVNLFTSQEYYRGQFRFDKRMLHKPLVR